MRSRLREKTVQGSVGRAAGPRRVRRAGSLTHDAECRMSKTVIMSAGQGSRGPSRGPPLADGIVSCYDDEVFSTMEEERGFTSWGRHAPGLGRQGGGGGRQPADATSTNLGRRVRRADPDGWLAGGPKGPARQARIRSTVTSGQSWCVAQRRILASTNQSHGADDLKQATAALRRLCVRRSVPTPVAGLEFSRCAPAEASAARRETAEPRGGRMTAGFTRPTISASIGIGHAPAWAKNIRRTKRGYVGARFDQCAGAFSAPITTEIRAQRTQAGRRSQ